MWCGPYTISTLLKNCLKEGIPRPPERDSVYLVSRRKWAESPTQKSVPLYVGSTTGVSARFRTRVGDVVADLFGFFGSETGHSSGGRSLHRYCRENGIHPNKLFIAWQDRCACARCEENRHFDSLRPLLNQRRPSRCAAHHP